MFFLAEETKTRKPEKKSVTTTSTAEAEYLALGSTVQECLWTSIIFLLQGKAQFHWLLLRNTTSGLFESQNTARGNGTMHNDIKVPACS